MTDMDVWRRLYVLAKDAAEILMESTSVEQQAQWEEWKDDARRVLPEARAALKAHEEPHVEVNEDG